MAPIAWRRLQPRVTKRAAPIHLLFALHFLKCYNTEEGNSSFFGVHEAKFRICAGFSTGCYLICKLYVIMLSIRMIYFDELTTSQIPWSDLVIGMWNLNCYASIDGSGFPIRKPYPFDPKCFSHKFNEPVVRYEIVVSINRDVMVWLNGPFAPERILI